MRDFLGLLAIVAAAAGGSIYLAELTFGVQFETTSDLRALVALHGYPTRSDGGGPAQISFYIADHPLDPSDVERVGSRHDCGLTPSWKGIVWVCQICSSGHDLVPSSIGGNTRIWGNVLLAGDGDLMDQLEKVIREGDGVKNR